MNDTTAPQTNPPQESLTQPKTIGAFSLLLVVVAAALAAGAVYYWQHAKISPLSKQINRYEQLVSLPNQACIGVSKASDDGVILSSFKLNETRQLYARDPDHKVASFTCTIGKNTKDFTKGREVAQVDSNGYEMGAQVIYFDNFASAKKYAEKKINPLRYWSVDQQGQQEGIPQTSKFTSLVNATQPYFDSYTVSDNALVRVSLPCEFSAKLSSDPWKCNGQAADTSVAYYTIKNFSESIKHLDF